jgi:hypothetical protein
VNDLSKSIIRSTSGIVAGAVVALLAHWGLGEFSGAASAYVVTIVAAAYTAGVRVAEKRWPQVGWLLGVPGPAQYPNKVFPASTVEPRNS